MAGSRAARSVETGSLCDLLGHLGLKGLWVQGGVQGLGFRVQGVGFRVQGLE